ncbi:hypothetical protein [Aquabacterium parvum]|nr:hypothetical protein [Aquabacterium parvum]
MSELFTATRSPDLLDVLANLLGVIAFSLLGRKLAKRQGWLRG